MYREIGGIVQRRGDVERTVQAVVTLKNSVGVAVFRDGSLAWIDIVSTGGRIALPLPSDSSQTIDRLTEYVRFLNMVREEAIKQARRV